MKIPKQSKPVQRAGFKNHLKIKSINKVMQSMMDDEVEEDAIDNGEEEGYSEADDTGEGADEAAE